MKDLIEKNKSALEYQYTITPKIEEICRPLSEFLGISYFGYIKIFIDGSYLHICNNVQWTQYYLTHIQRLKSDFFCEQIRATPFDSTHLSFLSFSPLQNSRDEILAPFYEELKIRDSFYIHKKSSNCIEAFCFGDKEQNNSPNNKYITQLRDIEIFIKYFINKCKEEIDCENKNKLSFFVQGAPIIKAILEKPQFDQREKFLKHIVLKNLNIDGREIKLSNQQLKCLSLLSQGQTMKEIGLSLDLSSRTIETHLNEIKNKTGYRYKSDLIKLYRDQIF